MIINRSKHGIAVDMKNPDGLEFARRLLAHSDVVLEIFRPGTMEKMDLGYPIVRELNPSLVYCKITAFGTDGPYAQRAGYDDAVGQLGGDLRPCRTAGLITFA